MHLTGVVVLLDNDAARVVVQQHAQQGWRRCCADEPACDRSLLAQLERRRKPGNNGRFLDCERPQRKLVASVAWIAGPREAEPRRQGVAALFRRLAVAALCIGRGGSGNGSQPHKGATHLLLCLSEGSAEEGAEQRGASRNHPPRRAQRFRDLCTGRWGRRASTVSWVQGSAKRRVWTTAWATSMRARAARAGGREGGRLAARLRHNVGTTAAHFDGGAASRTTLGRYGGRRRRRPRSNL